MNSSGYTSKAAYYLQITLSVGASFLKNAILCVYYVPEEMEWVFDLQLDQIRKCTKDYTIYAAFIKGSERVFNVLQESADIKICEVNAANSHPSKQHSMALTQLMRHAIDDGCGAIFTLDVDSFPIINDWMHTMIAMAEEGSGVCAVHRTENEDTFLPHPSGCVMLSSFVSQYPFEFYPENIEEVGSDYLEDTGQRPDSGIGLGYILWKHHFPWSEMQRSNSHNLHYLMAGIYGNVIFHLGAGSRRPLFAKELNDNSLLEKIKFFEKMPIFWRCYSILKKREEGKLISINSALVAEIETRLTENRDEFFKFLLS